ncbi:unnamed protein product [Ectocarpus sp. 12 AP-2014]
MTTEDPYVRPSLKRAVVELYDTCHRLLSFKMLSLWRRTSSWRKYLLPTRTRHQDPSSPTPKSFFALRVHMRTQHDSRGTMSTKQRHLQLLLHHGLVLKLQVSASTAAAAAQVAEMPEEEAIKVLR